MIENERWGEKVRVLFASSLLLPGLVSFLALFVLCLMFPYTGDDWAWGSSIGIERLTSGFVNYNGRYLGNLIILVLSRSIILRSLVVAFALVLIAYLICLLVGKKDVSMYCLALALVLLMPAGEGAQVVVWASGFTNYAIPTVLVLAYLNISKRDFLGGEKMPVSAPMFGALTLLGFASSLIVENVALFAVFMPFCLLVFVRLKYGFWSGRQLAFCIGAVIGACAMFSNGAYWIVASGGNAYQSASADLAGDRLFEVMPYWLLAYNWAIPACVSVAIAFLLLPEGGKPSFGKRAIRILAFGAMLTVLALCVYATFISGANASHNLLDKVMFVTLCAVSVLSVLYWVLHRRSSYVRLCLLLFCCIVVLVAPLMVVNPVGPRNFFLPYVLECAIACLVWAEFVKDASKLSSLLLAAITVAVLARWVTVYWPVHIADIKRNDAVAQAVADGESGVEVDKLPQSGYVHCPDPTTGVWLDRYKLFYGIPDDFDIRLK